MPVVLISIDATDNASSGIGRVANNLNTLDQSMSRFANSSRTAQQAIDQQARAYQSLDTAQARLQSSITAQEAATLRAARAMDQHRVAQAALASETGNLAAAQGRVERTFNAVISAQERAVSANQKVADSYRSLATAEDNAARAAQRAHNEMNRPTSTPKEGGSGHGGGIGGGLVRGAIAGAGATAGYYALSAAGQAFSDSLAFQRQSATTLATTGMTPDQYAAMQSFIQQQASSGTQPYSALTLAQGAYPIASVGVTDPKSMQAIMRASIMASAASGSTDVATTSDALVTAMHSMGIATKDMGRMAMPTEDILMTAVNRGKVDPTQVPGAFSRFVGLAGNKGMSLQDAAGLFTADTLTSPSALQSGQNMASLYRAATAPSQQQLRAASMIPGASDLLGPDVFRNMSASQWLTRMAAVTKGHEGEALPRLLGQADAANLVMNAIGPGGSKLQNTLGILQQEKLGGSTGAAFGAYEKSPAAQFDNSTTQFNTAVQNFMTAATPLATAMTQLATEGIHIIDDLVKKPGDTLGGAADTLRHLVTIGDPGFMSPDAARRAAGADQQAGRKPNTSGGFEATMNRFGDWLSGTDTLSYADAGKGLIKAAGGLGDALSGRGTLTYAEMFGGTSTARATGVGSSSTHSPAGTYSAEWYQSMGIPLGGANAVGHAPGTAPQAVSADYQNDVTRRAYVGRSQLAGIHAAPGAASGGGTSPAYGTADWATFDAYYGSPNRPRGGPPATGVGGAFAGLAQGVYGAARGDYFAHSLGGAAQGIYDQAQGMGIAAGGPNALRGGSGAAGGTAADALARKLEGDQLALTASQQNLDAARMMNATPDALNRINHEYLDAQRKLAKDTLTGPALTSALRGLDKQQAGGDYATAQADVQRRERDLQNRVQMDQLSGNAGAQARDQKALTAFMRANAGMLGLDASDLALQSAQDKAALLARTTPNPAPFHANQAGFGAFGGGEGSVSVRVGGGKDPQLEEIRHLREENSRLQHQVIDLLAGIKSNTANGRQAAQGSLLAHTGSNHSYKG